MVMGGVRGFNLFFPDEIHSLTDHAKVFLTDITLNEVSLETGYTGFPVNATYDYTSNNWWFEVAIKDYSLVSSVQYAFLLEGYDNDWINTGSHNSIRYLHLPPGKYKLYVKTATLNNTYGPPEFLYQFTILKPVYQRWWFICITILLGILLIYLILKIYLRNKYLIKIHTLEKEKAVQGERLRISKDMHDDIGTGISQIAILSELAKKTADIPETRQSVLNKISKVAGELIDNISNMIWITKPEYDNIGSLIYYMHEYSGSLFENSDIRLQFKSPENIPLIPVDNQARRNIFLIFKESLNNILKYSEAANISVQFEINDNLFSVRIKDDGKGFDIESSINKGDGLRNMKKRAEDCNGHLDIFSSPGNGAIIEFQMKIKNPTK